MQTLLEVLAEIRCLDDREALRFYNGFRTWKLTYRELYGQIGAFVAYLDRTGLQKGDRVLIWSENRPEWVSVFWACVARGVHVVPVDYRSSVELVQRIHAEVQARLIVTADAVHTEGMELPRFSMAELSGLPPNERFEASPISPDDVVEIVYTSGTTGEPMGVVHRHKNICANLTPSQSEMRKYKKWARLEPPFRTVARHFRPATARRRVRVHAGNARGGHSGHHPARARLGAGFGAEAADEFGARSRAQIPSAERSAKAQSYFRNSGALVAISQSARRAGLQILGAGSWWR
ncbi:MAG: hypothetical protein DMG58_11235 [Acidobacteria bacterium]|nr:MAG: hypothetical protein DMG58_11235 [Acidobacteriota bacterium]